MVKDKLIVGVIFGGRSGEHDVSLMSAKSVLDALDKSKYHIIQIGITREGKWLSGDDAWRAFSTGEFKRLKSVTILPDPTQAGLFLLDDVDESRLLKKISDIDVVFPVLHGTFGEDGTLQGLLEMGGYAYVGAGVLGSSVGMDKGVFKDVMRAHAIPVVESKVFLRRQIVEDVQSVIDEAEKISSYPLFVKPANLGSSVGVSKCHNRDELLVGLQDALKYDRRLLVERGVNAREIEISVLGNDNPEASIAGEIIPADEFYSYKAKYHDERSRLLIPAPIEPDLMDEMRQVAIQAYKAIDCAGMARVDFLLDKDDSSYYLNEVNTIPGFTKISMYPKLWEASGLDYPALLDRLIELAIERRTERDKLTHHFQME